MEIKIKMWITRNNEDVLKRKKERKKERCRLEETAKTFKRLKKERKKERCRLEKNSEDVQKTEKKKERRKERNKQTNRERMRDKEKLIIKKINKLINIPWEGNDVIKSYRFITDSCYIRVSRVVCPFFHCYWFWHLLRNG